MNDKLEQLKEKNWLTLFWVFVFPPFGLWKMWKNKDFSSRDRWVITGVIFLLGWLLNLSDNSSNYRRQASRPVNSNVGINFEETRRNSNIATVSEEIRVAMQGNKSVFDFAVKVEHVPWRGHDLLSCNINGSKGSCGVYEVVEVNGTFKAFWVNGKAKGKMGHKLSRTPSSIDPANAYSAIQK